MKVVGITKVRNESLIIQDTLDHFAEICDALTVYDDASTDETPDICEDHPAVVEVIRGSVWNPNRYDAEWQTRQRALAAALRHAPDWILCFDADERVEMPQGWQAHRGVRMKLFDFYITEEDKALPYTERRWMGPEYREILMAYRVFPGMRFQFKDQREMRLPTQNGVLRAGYVKHYGKAISAEQWEETCDYYARHFPEPYRTKWANRKGKAVHTESDWGHPLITWGEKAAKGFPLRA